MSFSQRVFVFYGQTAFFVCGTKIVGELECSVGAVWETQEHDVVVVYIGGILKEYGHLQ